MLTSRKFGVELETLLPRDIYDYDVIARILNDSGIDCRTSSYTHSRTRYWKIVSDGSISGSGLGAEFVSPVLRGDEGIAAVDKVCRTLRAAKVTVNATCGLHVHVDAEDFGLVQIKRLVRNFLHYEDLFDGVVEPSRRWSTNQYCCSNLGTFHYKKDRYGSPVHSSWNSAVTAADKAAALQKAKADMKTAHNIREVFNLFGGSRYFKMNLDAFWRHHTIEYRQHHGCLDAETVTSWIKLIVAFTEMSLLAKSSKRGTIEPCGILAFLKHCEDEYRKEVAALEAARAPQPAPATSLTSVIGRFAF
jgi:hypothetical protein